MTSQAMGAGRLVDVDGIGTYVQEAGSGHPIVLIHGAGPGATGQSNWSRNIAALACDFHVIVVDLPGFGQSQKMRIPPAFFEFYGLHLGKLLDAKAGRFMLTEYFINAREDRRAQLVAALRANAADIAGDEVDIAAARDAVEKERRENMARSRLDDVLAAARSGRFKLGAR